MLQTGRIDGLIKPGLIHSFLPLLPLPLLLPPPLPHLHHHHHRRHPPPHLHLPQVPHHHCDTRRNYARFIRNHMRTESSCKLGKGLKISIFCIKGTLHFFLEIGSFYNSPRVKQLSFTVFESIQPISGSGGSTFSLA